MKIAIVGYGKMGREIERLALSRNHIIHAVINTPADIYRAKGAEVAIEFTHPESAVDNIRSLLKMGIPVICGTTGWYETYPEIADFCREYSGAMICASNFSPGVNLLFELNRRLTIAIQPFSYIPSIREIHHCEKKDAPSGTAISLANAIIDSSDYTLWQLGKTENDVLGIEAHRKGEIKGVHHVRWDSEYDRLILSHIAHSREGFALGAILAAEWIAGKSGIFSMKDVLNL